MSLFGGLQSIANIHPLFVHFPIALLLSAGLLFIAGYSIKKEEILITAKYNLFLGAFFSIVTLITGFIAEDSLPHNKEIHDAMSIHEPLMIAVTILSVILSVYLFKTKHAALAKNKLRFFLIGLFCMIVLLVIGADYGGKMVFKYGASTELFKKVHADSNKGSDHSGDHDHGSHDH